MNIQLSLSPRPLFATIGLLFLCTSAMGQVNPPIGNVHWDTIPVSETVNVPAVSDGDGSQETLWYSKVFSPPATSGMRVHFASWNLPANVFVRLTSTLTGESAQMSGEILGDWSGYSPGFNGSGLLVEVVGRPPHAAASLKLDRLIALQGTTPSQFVPRNLCNLGTDNRVYDSPQAIARFWLTSNRGLCTASLVATGDVMVTAGHCANDMDSGAFVEFDPPLSNPDGSIPLGSPTRAFPYIDGSKVQAYTFIIDAQGHIMRHGEDGAAFRVGRNTLGQTAGFARGGFLHLLQTTVYGSNPHDNTKWGCGTGSGVKNGTLKKVDLGINGLSNIDGGDFWSFQQDTTGGDSGGPVVANWANAAVGVLSFSGTGDNDCNSGAYSFNDPSFAGVVENVIQSSSAVFLDTQAVGSPLGTIWHPILAFASAATLVPTNGRILCAPGSYSAHNVTVSTPCLISAPFGGVTIGN